MGGLRLAGLHIGDEGCHIAAEPTRLWLWVEHRNQLVLCLGQCLEQWRALWPPHNVKQACKVAIIGKPTWSVYKV